MEKQKKISLLIPLLLLFPFLGNAEIVTNTLQLRTNLLSICLMTDSTAGTNSQARVYEPLFSDKDFVSWNLRDHRFSVSQQAIKRFGGNQSVRDGSQFVVICSGEPIYRGVFKSLASSSSCSEPVILLEPLTKSATEVTYSIDRGYPSDEFGLGPDRRNDPRIISAVETLFGKQQPLPVLWDPAKPEPALGYPFAFDVVPHPQ